MLRPLNLLLILTCGPFLFAQDAQDWKQYNYDNAGWRFNRGEKALNAANAGTLEEKWCFW